MQQNKVGAVTASIIGILATKKEEEAAPFIYALRHSIGKSLDESMNVWPFFLEKMPVEFLSKNGKATQEERAIFTALQLYAIQQQGSKGQRENGKEKNIGASLRSIRTETTKSALDKRFLSMLSAKTFDALVYHLWQITKLAKAKGANPVDFARLANDLFWYQRGRAQEIRLQWASSYYRYGDDNEDDAMLENNGRKNA